MPAGYANHLCVYCQERPSTRIGDHVFARSFFAMNRRAYLPKAPGCMMCGGRKSELEHYLATVLPFGGLHADAVANLETAVPPRLEKNHRLKRELEAGLAVRSPLAGMTLPFDVTKLHSYFSFVSKGLLWHHWRRYLPATHDAIAFTPPDDVLPQIADGILGLNGERLSIDLGEGTFRYSVIASPTDPFLTAWFFQLMSGLQLTGDPERPEAVVSAVVAITTSHSSIERIKRVWFPADTKRNEGS